MKFLSLFLADVYLYLILSFFLIFILNSISLWLLMDRYFQFVWYDTYPRSEYSGMKCFGCWLKLHQWSGRSRIKNIIWNIHVVTDQALMQDKWLDGESNSHFTILRIYLWYQTPKTCLKKVLLCFVIMTDITLLLWGPPMNTFSTVSYRYLKAYEKSRTACPTYMGWFTTLLSWKARASWCKLRQLLPLTSNSSSAIRKASVCGAVSVLRAKWCRLARGLRAFHGTTHCG